MGNDYRETPEDYARDPGAPDFDDEREGWNEWWLCDLRRPTSDWYFRGIKWKFAPVQDQQR